MKLSKKNSFFNSFYDCITMCCWCTSKHTHSYDNDCDAICNTHGEKRTDIGHADGTATCVRLVKCEVCGVRYGELHKLGS
jgi:hypothetical protein